MFHYQTKYDPKGYISRPLLWWCFLDFWTTSLDICQGAWWSSLSWWPKLLNPSLHLQTWSFATDSSNFSCSSFASLRRCFALEREIRWHSLVIFDDLMASYFKYALMKFSKRSSIFKISIMLAFLISSKVEAMLVTNSARSSKEPAKNFVIYPHKAPYISKTKVDLKWQIDPCGLKVQALGL